jgi:hypothetical protein
MRTLCPYTTLFRSRMSFSAFTLCAAAGATVSVKLMAIAQAAGIVRNAFIVTVVIREMAD